MNEWTFAQLRLDYMTWNQSPDATYPITQCPFFLSRKSLVFGILLSSQSRKILSKRSGSVTRWPDPDSPGGQTCGTVAFVKGPSHGSCFPFNGGITRLCCGTKPAPSKHEMPSICTTCRRFTLGTITIFLKYHEYHVLFTPIRGKTCKSANIECRYPFVHEVHYQWLRMLDSIFQVSAPYKFRNWLNQLPEWLHNKAQQIYMPVHHTQSSWIFPISYEGCQQLWLGIQWWNLMIPIYGSQHMLHALCEDLKSQMQRWSSVTGW